MMIIMLSASLGFFSLSLLVLLIIWALIGDLGLWRARSGDGVQTF